MKILALSVLIALPVCVAQAGEPVPASAQAVAAQAEVSERDARHNCMRYTGSHIVQSRTERAKRVARADDTDADHEQMDHKRVASLEPEDCVNANGRVYSRSDLSRTGEVDLADALRKLDPAIR
ncbi:MULTISPECIES: hypothetical protein [unclassified Lysobacter]